MGYVAAFAAGFICFPFVALATVFVMEAGLWAAWVHDDKADRRS